MRPAAGGSRAFDLECESQPSSSHQEYRKNFPCSEPTFLLARGKSEQHRGCDPSGVSLRVIRISEPNILTSSEIPSSPEKRIKNTQMKKKTSRKKLPEQLAPAVLILHPFMFRRDSPSLTCHVFALGLRFGHFPPACPAEGMAGGALRSIASTIRDVRLTDACPPR